MRVAIVVLLILTAWLCFDILLMAGWTALKRHYQKPPKPIRKFRGKEW